jgi:hypothetical protein
LIALVAGELALAYEGSTVGTANLAAQQLFKLCANL